MYELACNISKSLECCFFNLRARAKEVECRRNDFYSFFSWFSAQHSTSRRELEWKQFSLCNLILWHFGQSKKKRQARLRTFYIIENSLFSLFSHFCYYTHRIYILNMPQYIFSPATGASSLVFPNGLYSRPSRCWISKRASRSVEGSHHRRSWEWAQVGFLSSCESWW